MQKEFEMAQEYFNKKIYVVMLDNIAKTDVPIQYVPWWIDVSRLQCAFAPKFSVEECADKIVGTIRFFAGASDVADKTRPSQPVVKVNPSQLVVKKKESQGLSYEVNSDGKTCVITGRGDCRAKNIYIPSEIDGLKVTSIGFKAFSGCESLKSVVIPDLITSIGANVFWGCASLKVIKCKVKSKPEGWDSEWKNFCRAKVVWGYKG